MIVGFSGKAGSGKSEACRALERFLGFQALAFADALKETVRGLFLLSADQVESQAGKAGLTEWGETPRSILQKFGVVMRREFGEDFWIKRLAVAWPGDGLVCVQDVRFPNEAAMIKSFGGRLIRCERPGLVGGTHESETALDDYDGFDAVLENDGTIGQWRSVVLEQVGEWLCGKT